METTNTIKPQDLRVGNIVREKESKRMVEVTAILCDNNRKRIVYTYIGGFNNSSKPYELEGVPVTEEMLNKLGFEKETHEKGDGISVDCYYDCYYKDGYCLYSKRGTEMPPLHYVQNGYFYLNEENQELDITPLYEEA